MPDQHTHTVVDRAIAIIDTGVAPEDAVWAMRYRPDESDRDGLRRAAAGAMGGAYLALTSQSAVGPNYPLLRGEEVERIPRPAFRRAARESAFMALTSMASAMNSARPTVVHGPRCEGAVDTGMQHGPDRRPCMPMPSSATERRHELASERGEGEWE